MVRLRKALLRVSRRFANWAGEDVPAPALDGLRVAQVTSALHFREQAGQHTTLRQLHKISELSQPEALSVVDQMERAGLVLIEHNMGDAFESTIRLTEDARQRLDRMQAPRAA